MSVDSPILVPIGRCPTMAASTVVKRFIYTLGKFCTLGPKNVAEGIDTCDVLRSCGISCTLGKFSKRGDDPVSIVEEYIEASGALESRQQAPFYLSLKPPALEFREDYATAITAAAFGKGHRIHFDSHRESEMDGTLTLLERTMKAFAANGDVSALQFGITLPSRWKRSIDDAGWAARHAVRTRVVKGEFKSDNEIDPHEGFLEIVNRLIDSVPEIAVATHDLVLAREAIELCKRSGTGVSLELLFGMPAGDMLALAKETEVPAVFYVPYGDTLFLYGLGHLLKNPHKLLRPGISDIAAPRRSKMKKICTIWSAGFTQAIRG